MKIVYIINKYSVSSIPIEIAEHLNKEHEVLIISFYSTTSYTTEIIQDLINCKHVCLNWTKYNGFAKFLKLIRILKNFQPDIVHTHHSFSGAITRLGISHFIKTKFVTTIHTDIARINKKQIKLLQLGLNKLDAVICNSQNTLKSFNKVFPKYYGLTKIVIYNGIDFKRIERNKSSNILSKYNLKKDDYIIGNIGRLEKVKDQKTIIKAFKLFSNNKNNVKLVIIGYGKMADELKELVKSLKLESNVIFTYAISKDATYQLLNNFNQFIMASKYEGFCNAAVEAIFSKTHIICSSIATLSEVTNYKGTYFKTGDANDLFEKMNDFYKNPNSYKEVIEELFSYANDNFEISTNIKNHNQLYKTLYN